MFCLSCSPLEKNVLFVQDNESVGYEAAVIYMYSWTVLNQFSAEWFQPA